LTVQVGAFSLLHGAGYGMAFSKHLTRNGAGFGPTEPKDRAESRNCPVRGRAFRCQPIDILRVQQGERETATSSPSEDAAVADAAAADAPGAAAGAVGVAAAVCRGDVAAFAKVTHNKPQLYGLASSFGAVQI
jgi:hypothetical protein